MSLSTFIRRNLVLCFGVALPVVITGFFFLATPQATMAPIKYDILLVEDNDYSMRGGPVSASVFVRDHRLYVQYSQSQPNQMTGIPRLYLYDAAEKSLRQLDLPPPDPSDASVMGTQILVDATKSMQLDTSLTSPDGFQFTYGNDSDEDVGLINDLLVGNRSRYGPRVGKDGRSYLLAEMAGYPQMRFLGWITGKAPDHG